MKRAQLVLLLGLILLAVLSWPPSSAWAIGWTERVSVSSSGEQGNGASYEGGISADGRFVAFQSDAADLVPGDTNGEWDFFVHDRQTGVTERGSVSSSGEQGNSGSYGGNGGNGGLSGDGRYVAFVSDATNLVPGDTNGTLDLFVHDRLTGVTDRVSVASDGTQADDTSDWPSLSGDGRFVAFYSKATDLVPGDTNGWYDNFVHDRLTGVTERVSVSSSGEQQYGMSDGLAPDAISADGQLVAFWSDAINLVPGDTNGVGDAFVHDRQTGVTERVSVSSTGEQGNGISGGPTLAISADGRYVVFDSGASNLVPGDTNGAMDTFVHDRLTGVTERVSVSSSGEQGNGYSYGGDGALSGDGRYVAFVSEATNLVSGDTNGQPDFFIRDRQAGTTELVSLSFDGSQPNGTTCWITSIGADGRVLGFNHNATNLVPGDTNGKIDAFVRVRWRFRDVPPGQWAFSQVEACVDANVVRGYSDETYRPSDPVTRDQMAVYISRGLVAPSGDAAIPDPPETATFSDVPTDYWAYKWVEYAVANSIVGGYWDGTYRPTNPVDRGQMAVFVARSIVTPHGDEGLVSYTPPETPTFSDVATDHWAYKYIEYIAQDSVAVSQGYPDGTYRPAVIVTRDQMAVYVQRAFRLPL